MEPFDLTKLPEPLSKTVVDSFELVPTNPSSLTLAPVGIGTLVLFGLGRRTWSRRTVLQLRTPTVKQQTSERRAA